MVLNLTVYVEMLFSSFISIEPIFRTFLAKKSISAYIPLKSTIWAKSSYTECLYFLVCMERGDPELYHGIKCKHTPGVYFFQVHRGLQQPPLG